MSPLLFLRQRGSGIGGSAMTLWRCAGCGAEQLSGSTAHDMLCAVCRKLGDDQLIQRMVQTIGEQAAALQDLRQTAGALRTAQRRYMKDRGNEELGANVAYWAEQLDKELGR